MLELHQQTANGQPREHQHVTGITPSWKIHVTPDHETRVDQLRHGMADVAGRRYARHALQEGTGGSRGPPLPQQDAGHALGRDPDGQKIGQHHAVPRIGPVPKGQMVLAQVLQGNLIKEMGRRGVHEVGLG